MSFLSLACHFTRVTALFLGALMFQGCPQAPTDPGVPPVDGGPLFDGGPVVPDPGPDAGPLPPNPPPPDGGNPQAAPGLGPVQVAVTQIFPLPAESGALVTSLTQVGTESFPPKAINLGASATVNSSGAMISVKHPYSSDVNTPLDVCRQDPSFDPTKASCKRIQAWFGRGPIPYFEGSGALLHSGFDLMRLQSDLTVDTTFGTLGVVHIDLAGKVNPRLVSAVRLANQTFVTSFTHDPLYAPSLVAFDASGARVSAFGTNGVVDLPEAGPLAATADGFVVLAQLNGKTQLSRFDGTGQRVMSFGQAGSVDIDSRTASLGHTYEHNDSVLVSRSGSLYVGGTRSDSTSQSQKYPFVLRLTAAGATDVSFATQGIADLATSRGHASVLALAEDEAGKVWVSIGTDQGSTLVRLLP